MREFRFRAYDSRNKEMRYSDKHDGEFWINTKGVLYMYMIPKTEKYYKTYDVMQYTGKLDKYGTEIWEGDIIEWKYDSHQRVVEWKYEEACFIARHLPNEPYCEPIYLNEDDELVINGNIYDNGILK